MRGYIYKITNLLNNKVYIGQTIYLNKRLNQHINSNKSYIGRTITKYGKDNFSFMVIFQTKEVTNDNKNRIYNILDYLERGYIEFYKSNIKSFGYNITSGAERLGNHSFNEEYCKRMSTAQTGKHHSEETKLKMSIGNTGKIRSLETRLKISNGLKGIKRTKEQIDKMSKGLAGKGCKRILQFTKEGKFVREFASIKEAAESVGVYSSCISEACNPKNRIKTIRGFIWKYKFLDEYYK